MRTLITFLLLIFSAGIHAQDINYARSILDTLCSEYFDGRGFYDDGEKRSAEFIENEYKKFGLQPFNNEYLQFFTLPVNSITGNLLLKLDNDELVAGADFLVDPSSPEFNEISKLAFLKKEELIDIEKFKLAIRSNNDKMIVIEPSLVKEEAKEVKDQVNDIFNF